MVDGRLCVWRVFGLSRNFTDRPPDIHAWTTAAESGPADGDRFAVTIGDMPDVIVKAVRAAAAFGTLTLDTAFGDAHRGRSLEERDQIVDALLADTDDVEAKLRGHFQNWITLEVSRPIQIGIRPLLRYLWVADHAALVTSQLVGTGSQAPAGV